MNPRYVAYARSQGRTSEEQLAHDEKQYPGGKMTGFMCWINEKWEEFSRFRTDLKHPQGFHRRSWLSTCYMAEFDAWLQETT